MSHMIEAIELTRDYVEGMDKATFLADRRTQQAVIMNILIIGEAATNARWRKMIRVPALRDHRAAVTASGKIAAGSIRSS